MNSQEAQKIFVSVVLPVFNGEKTLDRALQSILGQTRPVDEIVAINDGSIDRTGEILDHWTDKIPLTVLKNSENIGLTKSLQRGVSAAKGHIIFRLDADDLWFSEHVEKLLALYTAHPSAVLFAGCAEIRSTDENNVRISQIISEHNVRARLMWDNPIVHSSVAFKKDVYDRSNGYTGPTYAEDYNLWIEMLSLGSVAGSKDATIAYYEHPNSVSRIEKQTALSIRFSLQFKAILTFAVRHPVHAVSNLNLLCVRWVFLKLGLI